MFSELDAFLSILTFTPAIGALIIAVFRFASRPEDQALIDRNSRMVALVTTLVTLAFAGVMLLEFDPAVSGFQFVHEVLWLEQIGMGYRMGVDGISVLFVVLTAFLMPICILASGAIEKRVADYMIAFLLLETMILGVFTALDLVVFYVFFEGGLIPMFLIIGVWGGQNRVYAAFKFFLYTLLGSVLMLVAMIYMFLQAGTTDITVLLETSFAPQAQTWLWLAFFASFAVKMPMWPVHTWLPDAHVQAPTAGSVILAGVLLKMGGYGFLRFSLPMFPDASSYFAPMVFVLSLIAIVYTSLVAFRQTDIKKLIAYSSIAHMGFVTLGLFSMNMLGVQGAIFQMISHGFISSALFLCVGVIYDRMHTREIAFYGGVVHKMPVYAAIFGLFAMANVGLPGTSGFIGEIMTMVGGFQVAWWVGTGAAIGVILSAVYMLTVYRDVIFGEITNPKLNTLTDLNRTEWIIFVPLIIMTLLLGVFSTLVTDITAASVEALISNYDAALAAPAQ
ncbi:NADH-quinone oxidoreductase subunit M [Maricaulis sp.]|uniref:NADH-quinone oxidoreductase subunit M n=1 Tax=Maricaulis sp. TaxID=1486257 RepID=UPI003A8F8CF3